MTLFPVERRAWDDWRGVKIDERVKESLGACCCGGFSDRATGEVFIDQRS